MHLNASESLHLVSDLLNKQAHYLSQWAKLNPLVLSGNKIYSLQQVILPMQSLDSKNV